MFGCCATVDTMSKQSKMVFLIVAVIFMLMMSACAGLSVDERMDLAMECDAGDECDVLWDEYNKAAARLERRRAKREAGNCGRGMVHFCNATCMATRRHGEAYGQCVPAGSINIGSTNIF